MIFFKSHAFLPTDSSEEPNSNERYGYFEKRAKLVPAVRLLQTAESLKKGDYKIEFSVSDIDGNNIFNETHIVSAIPDITKNVEERICLEKCGLYWLQIAVFDSTGKILKQSRYPFAIIVNLPPITSVSSISPLGGHRMSAGQMAMGRLVGFKWDRFWSRAYCWPAIERTPGRFNWTWIDKAVKEAVDAGTEIVYTIHGVPGWASSAPENLEDVRRFAITNLKNPGKWKKASDESLRLLRECFPPKSMNLWEKFIGKLVSRYRKFIHHWEIINEPDAYMPYFVGTPEQYAALLRTAYETIHTIDPDAKVLGFSLCHDFWKHEGSRWIADNFLDRALKAGAGKYFDIFSYHN